MAVSSTRNKQASSAPAAHHNLRLAMLTICFVGIQLTWAVEMSYCPPYLLSLGMSKSMTALAMMAGPFTGIIIAPTIGALADQSQSPYGRRRPFILLGMIISPTCLLIMGRARELVDFFTGESVKAEASFSVAASCLAVLMLYGLDFSINMTMWSCRSLVADVLPRAAQEAGTAWSSRMSALGNLTGCLIGTVNLVDVFGLSASETQFKTLTVVSSAMLVLTVGITCLSVTEVPFVAPSGQQSMGASWRTIPLLLKSILRSMRTLPPLIQSTCWVQFWSWIGWFLFYTYGTTWVGEVYFRNDLSGEARKSRDVLGDMCRIGTLALVVFSIVSLVGSYVLPLFIWQPEAEVGPGGRGKSPRKKSKWQPDLLTAWYWGNLAFAGAMILAPLAKSFRFATALVAICGLSAAAANWVPYTIIGVYVSEEERSSADSPRIGTPAGPAAGYSALQQQDVHAKYETTAGEAGGSSSNLLPASEMPLPSLAAPGGAPAEGSGMYFGILNIYSTLPQFIGNALAMVIFALIEPGRSPELAGDGNGGNGDSAAPPVPGVGDGVAKPPAHGISAIGVCLFLGALSSGFAAVLARRMRGLMH